MFNVKSLRRRALLLPLLAAAAGLTACTTATPYQPLDLRGMSTGGFAEQRIEENRYRVTFVGNSMTSRERVENYLLFRAAELTVQAGFDGFTTVRRDTERDVDTRVMPSSFGRYHHWRPYWSWYGRPFGWRHWDPFYGDPFWADDVDVRQVERYQATAEIVMFLGQRANDMQSFDARQVMQNLGPTIQLPR